MPAIVSFQQTIEHSIESAIQEQIDRVKDDIVRRAVAEFEANVRKAVAGVTLNVLEMYSVQRTQKELVIHVQMEGTSGS